MWHSVISECNNSNEKNAEEYNATCSISDAIKCALHSLKSTAMLRYLFVTHSISEFDCYLPSLCCDSAIS